MDNVLPKYIMPFTKMAKKGGNAIMDSATDAINALTENAISFISSLPTTVVALIIVAVIMYLLGVTIRGTIKTIVGAFVMSIVLGAFGETQWTFW